MKALAPVTVVSVLSILLVPSLAFAHDDPTGSGEKKPAATAGAAEEAGAEPAEEKEPDWEVAGDFVAGATTLSVLDEGRPTRVESPPANVFDSMRATTYSIVVGVERKLGQRFTIGARMPVVDTDLKSRDGLADPRSEFIFGNLELEAAYVLAHGKTWEVQATLELALPTAGGSAQPTESEVAADPAKRFNYRSIDKLAAGRAANAARGAYESALFEAGHIGIVPKLSAKLHAGKLSITPIVKVENLIDVTGDEAEGYIGELVGGLRAGYLIGAHVEPGVHVWTNITYTEHDPFAALVVEPQLRFPLGRVTPSAGFLLPVAGTIADNKTFGIRVAVAGEF